MAIQTKKITENLYEFTECADFTGTGKPVPYVDAYLYIGESRAAVIDTLQTEEGLYGAVREITGLPLDVLITHGHLDHAGASARQFLEAGCNLYANRMDDALLPPCTDARWLTDIRGGETFDLGGITLEALSCGGHTPGCMVFLDRQRQIAFTGDTVGSGSFWMQLPCSLGLSLFQRNLQRLWDEVKNLPGLLLYPGHRNQSPVQLTGQYVKDALTVVNRVLNGSLAGKDVVLERPRPMKFKSVSHGMMRDFCYDPDNLKFSRPVPATEAIKDQFTAGSIRAGSREMDYMLFTPETRPCETYPLVVYLHGAGERGGDARLALANPGGYTFASPGWQEKHPCFVFAPQCAQDERWTDDAYMELIVKAVTEFTMGRKLPVDGNRVYVTGLSMGGMGTWKLISQYPGLFAAAMPVCGAGDPFAVREARDVPVWAFHAADDAVVPAFGYMPFENCQSMVGTRWLVASLRGAGNENVNYTEYPEGYLDSLGLLSHFAWVPAYGDEEAKEWLFAQNRGGRYEIHRLSRGLYWIEDYTGASIYVVEGEKRALVIDTGWGRNDFRAMIGSVTTLPYDLAVTHCYPDHMFHLDRFERYYMSGKDAPLLTTAVPAELAGSRDYLKPRLMPVQDGDIIDLGGTQIEVFSLGGHTPGSVVYLDTRHRAAFLGDALGVWLQVPSATDISAYQAELEHFLKRMSAPEYGDVYFLSGHRKQEGGYYPYGKQYTPNDLQKVRDMITLCGLVRNDDVEVKPYPYGSFGEPALAATYGQATLVFTESRVK